jgi:hypothetical protein
VSSRIGDKIKAAQVAMSAADRIDWAKVWEAIGAVLDEEIFPHHESVDTSSGDRSQTSQAIEQIYSLSTGAGSNNFNLLTLASQEGCRVRVEKVDTGAGVGTVNPYGAETFLGGATAFPLRKQGDFIEYEVQGGVAIVIDSLSTLDSATLVINQIQPLAHGLGVIPRKSPCSLVCVSAEQGYAVNDEIRVPILGYSASREWSASVDATYFYVQTDEIAVVLRRDAAGSTSTITMSKWKVRIRYEI